MTRGVGGESPSNVMKHLEGIDFPANKNDIMEKARSNDAPNEVVDILREMPDRKYGGPQEILKEYGKVE